MTATGESWQALAARHRELLRVVESMSCGLIVRDAAGQLVFANRTVLEWVGMTREELEHSTVGALTPPELRDVLRAEVQAIHAGDLRARLIVIQRKDGTTFPALALPQRLLDEAGQVVESFAVLVDLGTIQTAKQIGALPQEDLRAQLGRIALELRSLSLTARPGLAASLAFSHPELEQLTPRERQVLEKLAGGSRVPDIASQLFISPHTVRNHLKSIFRKVGVGSQAELLQRVRAL